MVSEEPEWAAELRKDTPAGKAGDPKGGGASLGKSAKGSPGKGPEESKGKAKGGTKGSPEGAKGATKGAEKGTSSDAKGPSKGATKGKSPDAASGASGAKGKGPEGHLVDPARGRGARGSQREDTTGRSGPLGRASGSSKVAPPKHRWGPSLEGSVPQNAIYHSLVAAARETVRKREEQGRMDEDPEAEDHEDPIDWTQKEGDSQGWEVAEVEREVEEDVVYDVESNPETQSTLGSDDQETEDMVAQRQELNVEDWHLNGMFPSLEDQAQRDPGKVPNLERAKQRREEIQQERRGAMTLRMAYQAAQDSFTAKDGQLKVAEEALRGAEEAARIAVQSRDRVLNEHRAAQERLTEATRALAQAKEQRRVRKAQSKEAKKGARGPAGTVVEEGDPRARALQEALQAQARLQEQMDALTARLRSVADQAGKAEGPEGLQQLREAALSLEEAIAPTPVQPQEEMDVSAGQGAAVPNTPSGETVPGLHEQQGMLQSQELLAGLQGSPPEPQAGKEVINVDAAETAPATPSRARREDPAEDSAQRDRSRDRERVVPKCRDKNQKKEEEEAKD